MGADIHEVTGLLTWHRDHLLTIPLYVTPTPIITLNGPFAANGHMVQNPPYWRVSYAQRKFKFDWIKSFCFGRPYKYKKQTWSREAN